MAKSRKKFSEVQDLIDQLLKEQNEAPVAPTKKVSKKTKTVKVEEPKEDIIEDTSEEAYKEEIKNIIQDQKKLHKKEWDVDLSMEIEYFDPNLSYELSGYKPINNESGLDFDPNWFLDTREAFLRTGHYCTFPRKTKAFNDFWDTQYRRCRDGMTVNGYTITGDHYFFLNFYQLDILTGTSKAGGGRQRSFPNFFVEQYKYFHYLELCKRLRKNCVLMKARGVGQQ